MKELRRILKTYFLRQIMVCWMILCMSILMPLQTAMAATPDYTNDGGATITQGDGYTDVLVNRIETIIEWSNFNTVVEETVSFEQGGLSNSAVLNRISGVQTQFNGELYGEDMRIFMVNPAGIVFGADAVIDVSQLVASGLNMSDAAFHSVAVDPMAEMVFSGGSGDITNNSESIYADRIALIGRNIYNNNALEASEHIIMAAGDTVRITDGSPVVVEVDMADFEHVIQNDSVIESTHIVLAAGDVFSTAYIYASDYSDTGAFASVTIDAAQDVEITPENLEEEYSIEVDAGYDEGAGQAFAKIDITAGRNVLIDGTGSDEGAGLSAYGYAFDGTGDGEGGKANPTGEINITAGGDLDILNSYVLAEGYSSTGDFFDNPGDDRLGEGTGIINITTDGSVILQNGAIYASGQSWDSTDNDIVNDHPGNGYATLTIDAGGSVVIQGESAIEAYSYAEDGNATAILDIDAVDNVSVGLDSYLEAHSEGGIYEVVANQKHSSTLDIQVGGNVIVDGLVEARAEAYDDSVVPVSTSTYAKVALKAMGNIVINETPGASDGLVIAEAFLADDNYAEVTMLAVENVIVNDGATAVSAEIVAWAEEDDSVANEALIGIATQNGSITLDGDLEAIASSDTGIDSSEIAILANEAVVVNGNISVWAFSLEGYATISIAAGGEISGDGSIDAQAATTSSLTIYATSEDNITFTGDTLVYGVESEEETVVIGPVDNSGPDWSWVTPPEAPEPEPTPEPESTDDDAPAAPLAQILDEIPTVEGCPQLIAAASMELGIVEPTIQVGIGNAMALNPSIQPCQACAALIDAASILKDADGSRMAAMVQAFNALAPADAPFTPATAASIATVFEGAAGSEQYASAIEYVDAFVQYVAILDIGLGSPVGDSVAFVMDKYGAGISGSDNANIASFVAMRLAAIGQ